MALWSTRGLLSYEYPRYSCVQLIGKPSGAVLKQFSCLYLAVLSFEGERDHIESNDFNTCIQQ